MTPGFQKLIRSSCSFKICVPLVDEWALSVMKCDFNLSNILLYSCQSITDKSVYESMLCVICLNTKMTLKYQAWLLY